MRDLKNILIIDNDPIAVYLTLRCITHMHPSFIEVREDGQDALTYMAGCAARIRPWPDLIFLDLVMSEADVKDFLERFDELNVEKHPTDMIVLSCVSIQRYNRNLLSSWGVRAFLEKPLTKQKLLEALQEINYAKIPDNYLC